MKDTYDAQKDGRESYEVGIAAIKQRVEAGEQTAVTQFTPGKEVAAAQSNVLHLPGEVTATSLSLPASLTEEDWKHVGQTIARAERSVAWWLGDWWAFGEAHEYGSRKAFAEELEAQGGFKYETCMKLGSISRRVETIRRRKVLPHSFHEEVAALDTGLQEEVLAWAEEQWPKVTVRDVRRAARRAKAGTRKDTAFPDGRYRVIYADPPWSYGNEMPSGTTTQEDHYPLMPLADICAMPVKELAADNAVLFLWVTSPIMQEAAQVIEAWGFQYKAAFIWDKIKHNMGHYNSVRHELLLICVRGSCPPDEQKLFDSVQSIERKEHSAKPEEFRSIIDTLYPVGPRIELFNRAGAPDGWEVWGNE